MTKTPGELQEENAALRRLLAAIAAAADMPYPDYGDRTMPLHLTDVRYADAMAMRLGDIYLAATGALHPDTAALGARGTDMDTEQLRARAAREVRYPHKAVPGAQ